MAKRNITAPLAPNNGRAKKEVTPNPSSPLMGAGGAFLPFLILIYLLLSLGYSALTPAATPDQHNPDENAHMEYVAKIAAGHLPVFTGAQHGYENHQPPLYYALCAPVYLAAHGRGESVATKAVRGVSILFGAVLIWVTFRCIALLFPGEPALALGMAAFVGLLPGNVALSASVTNDALTNLLCAVCLWRLGALASEPETVTKEAVWIGLVLGVGIWTKTSTLTLYPVALFAYYLLARQGRLSVSVAFRGCAMSLGMGLLIGLPWLIRNTILYGDPVAQRLFLTAFSGTAQADVIARYVFGGFITAYLQGVGQWTFASFWGVFDSMRLFWGQNPHGRTPSPSSPLLPMYNVLALLSLAPLAGLALQRRRVRLTPSQQVMLPVFAVLTALVIVVFFRFILTFFQAQGRYLYPALLPLVFYFVWGWQGFLPCREWFRTFVGMMTLGFIALNLWTLFGLLLPRFA